MTKFIRTLIIINGVIIPIILIVFLVTIIADRLRYSDGYEPIPIGLDNIITKDGDTLITQGLRYYKPQNIYNSTNKVIRISPKNYKNPKLSDSKSANFEGGITDAAMIRMPGFDEYYVNLLFLDSDYKLICKLLYKKAAIIDLKLPSGEYYEEPDTTCKNIGYLIAFNDSNDDKLIDWNDQSDLFITDLRGQNLIQVTKDIDVIDYEFINNHKDILISFNDRNDLPDEYKILRFSIFNIETNKLKNLTEIDKVINGVQMILNN